MNNKYPWKQAMATGVIIGLFTLIFFQVLDNLNSRFAWGLYPMTMRGITGLVTIVILGIGIYVSMLAVRKYNGGLLSFRQAFLAGVITALITGILVAGCTFVYCRLLNPGFSDYMLSETRKVMVAQGQGPAAIAADLAVLRKQLSTPAQVFQAFFGQLTGGTLLSAVLGLFVKTKNRKV